MKIKMKTKDQKVGVAIIDAPAPQISSPDIDSPISLIGVGDILKLNKYKESLEQKN